MVLSMLSSFQKNAVGAGSGIKSFICVHATLECTDEGTSAGRDNIE